MSKNSLISYQKTLLEYGLIKKTTGRRTAQGNYRSNLYKVTPIRSPKNEPGQVQKLDTGSPKIALDQVQNLHPNNTNPNNTNITTTNGGKDAVVVVNFKKLKEKGEERMQVIREQMVKLDFKDEFIEKTLKEYSMKKIEEKLDLLMERKNVQSPAGWLRSALKNDYRDEERERYGEEPAKQAICSTSHPHLNPPPSRGRKLIDNPLLQKERKIEVSREKDLKAIKLIQDNLSACISPIPRRKRAGVRENVGVRFIEPAKLRGG